MSDEVYNYVGKPTIWVCQNDKCKVAAMLVVAAVIETGQGMQCISRKKSAGARKKANGTKANKVMVDLLAVEAESFRGQSNQPGNGHVKNKPYNLHGQGRIPRKKQGQKYSGKRPSRKHRKGGSRSSQ